MNGYRYPVSALRGDYLRAGTGMVFSGLFLYGASSVPVMFVIVISVFLLFAGYGVKTWSRHMTMIQLEEEGLRVFGLRRRTINWEDIEGAKLRFFTVKRDRDAGWMELTLTTTVGKFKIESDIDGFNEIAGAVARALEANAVVFDANSVENFNAIGIETNSPGLPEAAKRFDKFKPWQDGRSG